MELTAADRENIRRNAYFSWLDAGAPHGDGIQFWLQAESQYKHALDADEPLHQAARQQQAQALQGADWEPDLAEMEPGRVRTSEEVLIGSH